MCGCVTRPSSEPSGNAIRILSRLSTLISSHRAALDFDKGYLNKIKTADGYNFVAELKSEKQSLIKLEYGSEKRGGERRRRIQPQYPYKNKKQKANDNTGF